MILLHSTPFQPLPTLPGRKASGFRWATPPQTLCLCSGYFRSLGNASSKLEAADYFFSVGSLFSALPAALLAAWLRGLCTPRALPHSPGAAQSHFPGCLPSMFAQAPCGSRGSRYNDGFVGGQRREAERTFQYGDYRQSHGGIHVAPTRMNEQDVPTESATQRGQWVQGQGGQKPGTC